MARHEGDIRADSHGPLSLVDLLKLIGTAGERDGVTREDAIACYLSGEEGWRDAVKRLGGTFAGDAAGLRERKGD